MIQLEEFRARLLAGEQDELLDEVLLANGARHVNDEDISYIRQQLASRFRIDERSISVLITGSAKLGFSIVEKRHNGTYLPRYRSFSARSDIDVAVVSPTLFELIWRGLTKRAHRVAMLPWDSGKLGDYMVYGWLRPDYFPNDVRVRQCDAWWDQFRRLSSNPRFQRHKVRGGLFYSKDQLRSYMQRAVRDCADAEELMS